ncbi:hypothetical protein ACFQX7_32575 [Luedemannella flava]
MLCLAGGAVAVEETDATYLYVVPPGVGDDELVADILTGEDRWIIGSDGRHVFVWAADGSVCRHDLMGTAGITSATSLPGFSGDDGGTLVNAGPLLVAGRNAGGTMTVTAFDRRA